MMNVIKCCSKLINLKNSKTKWSHLTSCQRLEKYPVQNFTNSVAGVWGLRSLSWVALNEATPTGTATKHAIEGKHKSKVCYYVRDRLKFVHFNRNWMLTILKEAKDRQQVFSSQDPLTPWHLHSTFMFLSSSWKRYKNKSSGLVLVSCKTIQFVKLFIAFMEMTFSDNGIKFSFSLSLKEKCLMLPS